MNQMVLRRIAVVVVATILAVSGAAATTATFANDAQAAINTGNFVGQGEV